jgi:FkbM family methyltransferase
MNILKRSIIEVFRFVLPAQAKRSLFHLSFHLAPDEFEEFSYRYAHAPNQRLALCSLAARGFEPKTIVDVGAFQGRWSEMVRNIWPASDLFMIEPNADRDSRVRQVATDLGATLFDQLLGATNGDKVDFNVMGSGSSVMNERSPLTRAKVTRELATLDSLISDVRPPALLKIDAQGYELEILKGSSRLLSDFEAVLLEVAIIEVNEGAPLIDSVLSFMKRLGFVAYDILEIHRRPLDQALNQLDILFVKECSDLIRDKSHYA